MPRTASSIRAWPRRTERTIGNPAPVGSQERQGFDSALLYCTANPACSGGQSNPVNPSVIAYINVQIANMGSFVVSEFSFVSC